MQQNNVIVEVMLFCTFILSSTAGKRNVFEDQYTFVSVISLTTIAGKDQE